MLLEECLQDLVYITAVLARESVGRGLVLDVVELPRLFIVVGCIVCLVVHLFLSLVRCGSCWRLGYFAMGTEFGGKAYAAADGF